MKKASSEKIRQWIRNNEKVLETVQRQHNYDERVSSILQYNLTLDINRSDFQEQVLDNINGLSVIKFEDASTLGEGRENFNEHQLPNNNTLNIFSHRYRSGVHLDGS